MTDFSNGYSNFVPEIWSKKLNSILHATCPMLQCVNRNWEGEIASAGDKVNILTPPNVSVSTLTGDSLTYSELAPSKLTLVVDQRKFFAFKVNDIGKAQANTEFVSKYMENAKKSLETAQDSYLLGLHTQVSNDNTIGSDKDAVVLTTSNIYAKFVDLAATLKTSNAYTSGSTPWVVINPEIEAILLKTSQFTSASNLGSETIRNGAIGKIAGMDIMVTNNLTPVSNLTYVLAGTNDAITFASKVITLETIRDVNSFSDIVRGLYVYGAKVVNSGALAKMVVGTSA